MTSPSPVVTVAILTFNGEQYLDAILHAVFDQDIDASVEVLVIDSGSTDRTLEIVADYPEVVLHSIPNSEFGHGKTRNLAAQLGRGEFIAYLTHDAIPVRSWLRELLVPFSLDQQLVAVMGKQIPRATCFPLMKYEIKGVFAGLGPDFGTTVFYKDDFVSSDGVRDAVAFYSDVNSAARREFLISSIPYQDVRYAEDQLFGRDVIEGGFKKAYAPRAAVEHSNDLTLAEFGRRIFDETVGLRQIGFDIPPMTLKYRLKLTIRGIVGDSLRIARDHDYSRKRKLYWLVMNPRYHWTKWRSYRVSTLVDLGDAEAVASGSLEHSRKRQSDQA